jgi:HD-GYP domain-containing protein (c-di-GMP phosphodiesterase class II)
MAQGIDKGMLRSLVGLASVVEVRDPYTGGHLWRVGQFSKLLAEYAGMDAEQVFLTSLGGVLHDLGKIAVPDAILRKPDKLTDAEYDVIKTHPAVGRDLLGAHPLAHLAVDAVYRHHEHHAGGGYPEGLAGEQIPVIARIVGLTDAFDAMTSSRPYRRGMPIEKALSILAQEAGRQFDPVMAKLFGELHAKHDRVAHIVGHSDHGQKLVSCPMCGPIIAVPRYFKNGDIALCRACGSKFELHRDGDTFAPEPVGKTASADDLRPRPEEDSLEEFVVAAPPPKSRFALSRLMGTR